MIVTVHDKHLLLQRLKQWISKVEYYLKHTTYKNPFITKNNLKKMWVDRASKIISCLQNERLDLFDWISNIDLLSHIGFVVVNDCGCSLADLRVKSNLVIKHVENYNFSKYINNLWEIYR
jgi:hypothetical protein